MTTSTHLRRTLAFVALVLTGAATFGAASAVAQTAATTTTLAITASGHAATTVAGGTPVTFTATVVTGTAPSTTPVTAGSVNFCEATAPICSDIHLLGSALLGSGGTATLVVTPPLGVHSYKAVYTSIVGDGVSASPATGLTVSAATTTTISQTGSTGNYTLKATVTGKGLSTAPSGTVNFVNTSSSNAVVASVNLAAGSPGAAVWSNPQSPAVPTEPVSILVADFNGDGIPDIAVGTQSSVAGTSTVPAHLSILLGNGDGTFQSAQNITSSISNSAMVADHFVRGGPLDILSVDNNAAGTNNAALLIGNGTGGGTLQTPFSLNGLANVTDIAAADFNRDGKEDFVVAGVSYGIYCFAPLLGNGDGTFGTPTLNAIGNNPISVAVGAFGANGYPDIAVADSGANQVTLFQNNGQGYFFPEGQANTGTTPVALVTGDFNGDGFLDLAVANEGSGNVTILLGHGNEMLTVATTIGVGKSPTGIAVGDFNHDGIPDLAVVNSGDGNVTILTGVGDGTFNATATPSTGTTPLSLVAGNFSGTGIDSLAVANEDPASTTGSTVTVLASTQTQTSTATANSVSVNGTGAQLVDASYLGDTNYAASVSSTTSLNSSTPAYSIAVSPTTLTFPSTVTGTTSAAQIVTLTNNGQNAVALSSISASNSFAVSSACASSLTAGASCNLSVTFSPAAGLTGTQTGTLTIADNATGSPQTVALSGTATAPPPTVTLLPSTLSFPATLVGASSAAQTVTLSNTGQSAVTVASLALSPSFVASTTCPASLPVAGHCTFSVVFAPSTAGNISGTLSLSDSATGSPQIVTLSGTATLPAPTVSVSPTTLTFAAADIGTTSAAQTVTLTNTGGSAVSLSSIAVSGAFTENNTCGTSLAVSASCTIAIVFAPTTAGSATGSLTLTDSATGSPQTVALSGTGESVSILLPTSAPLTLNAGNTTSTVTLNISSAQGFTGTVNLGCVVNFLGTGSAVNAPTCSLSPTSGQVTSSQSLTSTLTVTLKQSTATARVRDSRFAPNDSSPMRSPWVGGSAALAGLLCLGYLPRRRWRGIRLAVFFTVGLGLSGMVTGCGGSSGPQATPGNYSVVVTATSATVSVSATIPLTVQ